MSVPRSGLRLGMTEYPPHHRQALASHHRLRGERVTEIVDPHVLQFRGLANPPPRLLQVREVCVLFGSDDDVGIIRGDRGGTGQGRGCADRRLRHLRHTKPSRAHGAQSKDRRESEHRRLDRSDVQARQAVEGCSERGKRIVGPAHPVLDDKSLPGFGLRIHPSGRKVWIVQARIEGRSRRVVIARYGAMRLAQARRRARDMLDRIRAGGNPADDIRREKQAPIFREFADEYLRRSDPHWKPSGRETVRIYLKARILPAFGRMPLDRIGPEDVAAWFDAASKDKPGAANRALEILRAMMFRAEEWGLRKRDTNPCLGIDMNPRKRVARFLDADELARLGRALDRHEARWPEAVAAIRLLALTGCRRSEVLDLLWLRIPTDLTADSYFT